MATTLSLHTVDCGTAVEAAAPVTMLADVPAEALGNQHKCVYYLDPKPSQVRVMAVVDE